MTTTARLLRLLSLLQTRRDWPGSVLAERLDISDRTVRRDVDRLRELGYSIHATMGPDGGYRLDAGSDLPPLLFDDEQAVAIAVALQSASAAGAPFAEASVRALTTVRQVMPSRLRHRIDALQITALGDGAKLDVDVLVALSTAIRDQLVLRFDYADQLRRAEPHSLVTRANRWYLVAWDLDRDAWRTFRVDRIAPRTPTGPRFTPRALDDVAGFVAGSFKGNMDADTWPCTGAVTLALPASAVAPYIADGTVEPLDAHTCRVSLGSWSWVGLAASIARFDADVSDVSPPALVQAFATLARRFG